MIVVIDNYDSFTYNLVQLLGKLAADVRVFRNDEIAVEAVHALDPCGVLISPGPGRPENAGISVRLIKELGERTPILGVCLGHQAIGFAFGASVVDAPVLMHGKTSRIYHHETRLFQNMPNPFNATRYHSLVVSPEALPEELEITARTEEGVIMGVRHRHFPVEGVQFHPESILTTLGERLLENWLQVHHSR